MVGGYSTHRAINIPTIINSVNSPFYLRILYHLQKYKDYYKWWYNKKNKQDSLRRLPLCLSLSLSRYPCLFFFSVKKWVLSVEAGWEVTCHDNRWKAGVCPTPVPLCSAVLFSAVKCSAVQCSVVKCSAVQCSAVQCSAVKSERVTTSEVMLQRKPWGLWCV